jgi:hypothetical protein
MGSVAQVKGERQAFTTRALEKKEVDSRKRKL